MIYKSQNKTEKSKNQKPGGAENTKDAPAEDTRQERYRRYQRYEELKRRHREKRKQFELLGFIGTDKMARMDEDVNNRLFRREIRILTLLL